MSRKWDVNGGGSGVFGVVGGGARKRHALQKSKHDARCDIALCELHNRHVGGNVPRCAAYLNSMDSTTAFCPNLDIAAQSLAAEGRTQLECAVQNTKWRLTIFERAEV